MLIHAFLYCVLILNLIFYHIKKIHLLKFISFLVKVYVLLNYLYKLFYLKDLILKKHDQNYYLNHLINGHEVRELWLAQELLEGEMEEGGNLEEAL